MSVTAPGSFSIRSSQERGIARLQPIGELDITTAPILKRAFEAALDDHQGSERIVVDLTEVSFMDSTGIHLLLQMNAACRGTGRLRVVNGSQAVVRVLDVSGVREVLPIISSDQDPLQPLSSPWTRAAQQA
ncbi:MAG TPA: STAS domain-containing protein [Solirubrobacteraceae bacterium]|nr:STAS domain-containing protein [Solirubrobacteraceae bacterium]